MTVRVHCPLSDTDDANAGSVVTVAAAVAATVSPANVNVSLFLIGLIMAASMAAAGRRTLSHRFHGAAVIS
jgi:hypothetical protein